MDISLRMTWHCRLAACCALAVFACSGATSRGVIAAGTAIKDEVRSSDNAFYATRFARTPTVAEMGALGRKMFFDRSLSASRNLSCASCHDPRFAFGPPNALPVQQRWPRLLGQVFWFLK